MKKVQISILLHQNKSVIPSSMNVLKHCIYVQSRLYAQNYVSRDRVFTEVLVEGSILNELRLRDIPKPIPVTVTTCELGSSAGCQQLVSSQ